MHKLIGLVMLSAMSTSAEAARLCFADADDDGFGGFTTVFSWDNSCNGAGEAAQLGDCDDDNPEVHPDATEILDYGVDNDCDGIADNGYRAQDVAQDLPFQLVTTFDGYVQHAGAVQQNIPLPQTCALTLGEVTTYTPFGYAALEAPLGAQVAWDCSDDPVGQPLVYHVYEDDDFVHPVVLTEIDGVTCQLTGGEVGFTGFPLVGEFDGPMEFICGTVEHRVGTYEDMDDAYWSLDVAGITVPWETPAIAADEFSLDGGRMVLVRDVYGDFYSTTSNNPVYNLKSYVKPLEMTPLVVDSVEEVEAIIAELDSSGGGGGCEMSEVQGSYGWVVLHCETADGEDQIAVLDASAIADPDSGKIGHYAFEGAQFSADLELTDGTSVQATVGSAEGCVDFDDDGCLSLSATVAEVGITFETDSGVDIHVGLSAGVGGGVDLTDGQVTFEVKFIIVIGFTVDREQLDDHINDALDSIPRDGDSDSFGDWFTDGLFSGSGTFL
jgi:hypothetical protein